MAVPMSGCPEQKEGHANHEEERLTRPPTVLVERRRAASTWAA